jgi:hypothetical protein
MYIHICIYSHHVLTWRCLATHTHRVLTPTHTIRVPHIIYIHIHTYSHRVLTWRCLATRTYAYSPRTHSVLTPVCATRVSADRHRHIRIAHRVLTLISRSTNSLHTHSHLHIHSYVHSKSVPIGTDVNNFPYLRLAALQAVNVPLRVEHALLDVAHVRPTFAPVSVENRGALCCRWR